MPNKAQFPALILILLWTLFCPTHTYAQNSTLIDGKYRLNRLELLLRTQNNVSESKRRDFSVIKRGIFDIPKKFQRSRQHFG